MRARFAVRSGSPPSRRRPSSPAGPVGGLLRGLLAAEVGEVDQAAEHLGEDRVERRDVLRTGPAG